LQDDIQQKPTDIIKYDFKNGLPQEFEIVDKVELYKESKDTLTTTHATGFYHIIWFQNGGPTQILQVKFTSYTTEFRDR
jgi:hypothetical protein